MSSNAKASRREGKVVGASWNQVRGSKKIVWHKIWRKKYPTFLHGVSPERGQVCIQTQWLEHCQVYLHKQDLKDGKELLAEGDMALLPRILCCCLDEIRWNPNLVSAWLGPDWMPCNWNLVLLTNFHLKPRGCPSFPIDCWVSWREKSPPLCKVLVQLYSDSHGLGAAEAWWRSWRGKDLVTSAHGKKKTAVRQGWRWWDDVIFTCKCQEWWHGKDWHVKIGTLKLVNRI